MEDETIVKVFEAAEFIAVVVVGLIALGFFIYFMVYFVGQAVNLLKDQLQGL